LGARTLPTDVPPQGKRHARSAPYLIALGAPPLTFQEPVVPLIEVTPSTAVAPTRLTPPPGETTSAASVAPTPSLPVRADAEMRVAEINLPRKEPSGEPKRTPSILPDDARPTIRPEDFLPYFQIPGSAKNSDDVNLLVPVPRSVPTPPTLPPSSATYTITPK
ncbi:MAG: hypothetical protein ABIR80_14370, partial [Opitutaceae bacterium]